MILKKFEDLVKKYPDNIAVKTTNGKLSYQELNNHANALACDVINRYDSIDFKKQKIVALLFEHGIDMIVGTMGVLKARHIYVPMDPNYPLKLLAYMLEDSEANFIITNNKNAELATRLVQLVNTEVKIINISEIKTTDFVANVNQESDSNDCMYILYTSGSTGRPKGVIQSYKNVFHFAECYKNAISITPRDNMTLLSSFSHDAAIVDIYSALSSGATLCPYDIKLQPSKSNLVSWLKDEQITIWHSVPTLYRYFIDMIMENDDLSALRFIVLGGENILLHDIKMFQKIFKTAKFASIYGQTESSINSIQIYSADSEVDEITLGEQVQETELVVIDENREEVSPLKVGEIVILSNYIALGYWKDETKTSEVFRDIPNIGRTYSTGDLGRLLLDGSVEFLGRIDHQVKIRGYRIELGEIESQLLELKGVKEAVVIAREDNSGDKYLRAYIVAEDEITANEMRKWLSENLPDYMIPSYFVRLEVLPLTPNGKVDRRALPAPEGGADAEYVAPRTTTEEILARIWAEVLGVKRVGVHDNFFNLGGHSLKGTVLVSRIHKELNVEIPLKELFSTPTIAGLSKYISSAEESVYAAIEPAGIKNYYAVSPAQKRMWLLRQLDPVGMGYNMPGVLAMDGELDRERLETAFSGLIARHETLRTSFEMISGEIVQRITEKVDFGIEYSESTEENINEVIKEFIRPFDLSKAPLLRVALVKVTETRHFLLFDMHHIISDG
ncbi:MAG: amino acid adenylation domain-containing protein, partial [Bacillota bacterium]